MNLLNNIHVRNNKLLMEVSFNGSQLVIVKDHGKIKEYQELFGILLEKYKGYRKCT